MINCIIGIAGHIDHGKTKLTKALTNIETDLLKEEKEKGISIKLGFAYMILKNNKKIGIIDVPGHEKFIKQMISSAGGMDLVLLVIASNEGIMPQTKEHLEIIKLLKIKNLIIVITKKDIVEIKFLNLIKEDIKKYLINNNYNFYDVPIIAVDSLSKNGIKNLKNEIEKKIIKMPKKEESFCLRLPIDRKFLLKGFGVIITGTLCSGNISKGDFLFLFPNNKKIKVKNIQVYGENTNIAYLGQRVALNISGINIKEIESGSLLINNNKIFSTYIIAANIYLLKDRYIYNKQKVYLYIGTSEIFSKLIIVKKNVQNIFCIFYLEKPAICIKGDRIIIRSQNPKYTIGCAIVFESIMKNEKNIEYFKKLKIISNKNEDHILLNLINDNPFKNLKELSELMQKKIDLIANIIKKINENIYKIGDLYISKKKYKEYKILIKKYIKKYINNFPFREGLPKEDLRNKYFKNINFKIFNIFLNFLNQSKFLVINKNFLMPDNKIVKLDIKNKDILFQIQFLFLDDLINIDEIEKKIKKEKKIIIECLNYLIRKEIIIKIFKEYYLKKEVFLNNKDKIVEYIKKNDNIKLIEAKEILNISRKNVVIFLEYLDLIKITKRIKEKRILLNNGGQIK